MGISFNVQMSKLLIIGMFKAYCCSCRLQSVGNVLPAVEKYELKNTFHSANRLFRFVLKS